MKKTFVLLLLTIVLSSCAIFSDQSRKHIIEDKIGPEGHKIGTLSMVAQRRVFLVRYPDGEFCAEPSPDAVDNLASALSASLAGGNKSVDVTGSVAASFASNAKQLFFRSQGLQLYRDGTFALCNMYLNNVIDKEQYRAMQSDLLKAVIPLIQAQFRYLEKTPVDVGKEANAPQLPQPTKTDQNPKK